MFGDDLEDFVGDGIAGRSSCCRWRGHGRTGSVCLHLERGHSDGLRQVGPVVAHEADDRTQRRIVAQLHVVAAGDVEGLPDGQEGFGLLDGVNAQVGLHVQVKVEHFLWIAGLLGDDLEDFAGHGIDGGDDERRLTDYGRRCRLRIACRRLGPVVRGRLPQIGPIGTHKTDDRIQCWVVAQLHVVAAGDVEGLADGQEGLGLLDGVNAQVGLHVEVKVEHVLRVAGLLGDDLEDFAGHGIERGSGRDDRRRSINHSRSCCLWPVVRGRLSVAGRRQFFLDGGDRRGLRGGRRERRFRFWRWAGGSNRHGRGGRRGRAAVAGRRHIHHPGWGVDRTRLATAGGADCWASAGLPAIGHRRPGRVARGDDAQHVLDDFSLGCVVAADIGQPALVEWLVIHAVEAAGDTPGEG